MIPMYTSCSLEERESVALRCLKGDNSNRQRIASEIRFGDLFNAAGVPYTYWHCLATNPPPPPENREGQWKATPGDYGGARWIWQDWGPVKSVQDRVTFELAPFGKYQGHPVEDMFADQRYMNWLNLQPWFREKFTDLIAQYDAWKAAANRKADIV